MGGGQRPTCPFRLPLAPSPPHKSPMLMSGYTLRPPLLSALPLHDPSFSATATSAPCRDAPCVPIVVCCSHFSRAFVVAVRSAPSHFTAVRFICRSPHAVFYNQPPGKNCFFGPAAIPWTRLSLIRWFYLDCSVLFRERPGLEEC